MDRKFGLLSLFYDCTIERNFSAVDKSCCSDGVVYSIAFNSSKSDEVLTPRYADITAGTFVSRTADADLTALCRDGAARDGDITAGTPVPAADADIIALRRDGAASDGDITAGTTHAADAYITALRRDGAASDDDITAGASIPASDSDLTALRRDGATRDGDITAGATRPASDAYIAILECEVAALNRDVATSNVFSAADACRGTAFSRKFAIARDDEL